MLVYAGFVKVVRDPDLNHCTCKYQTGVHVQYDTTFKHNKPFYVGLCWPFLEECWWSGFAAVFTKSNNYNCWVYACTKNVSTKLVYNVLIVVTL